MSQRLCHNYGNPVLRRIKYRAGFEFVERFLRTGHSYFDRAPYERTIVMEYMTQSKARDDKKETWYDDNSGYEILRLRSEFHHLLASRFWQAVRKCHLEGVLRLSSLLTMLIVILEGAKRPKNLSAQDKFHD